MITGKTQLLGVIGNPIEHSLSPVLHNAVLDHLGLDYVYLPFPVKPEDLESAIAGFTAIGIVGFNVTIPHKQTIMSHLDGITSSAQQVGAVNTVWRIRGGWEGTNTDVEGFIAPIQAYAYHWSDVIPVILGNGGAARAVVAGCAQLGCSKIAVVGRNPDKLAQFQASWENTGLTASIHTYQWEQLPDLIPQTRLLVNTTPIGMSPNSDASPVEERLFQQFPRDAIAYDLIYNPRPTRFLQLAQQHHVSAIDGLEMLIQQAAAALEIWIQQPVPVDIMKQAINKQW